MEVFRISSIKYSSSLSASGKNARRNKENQFVLYCGSSRSLSALELTAHKNIQTNLIYEMMIIYLSDSDNLYTRFHQEDMPPLWRNYRSYSILQEIGSKWYINKKSLILQVPSAIIPQEYNYVINTTHPDYNEQNISLIKTEEFNPDQRLIE